MRKILGRDDIDIPAFSRHLHAFCDTERGKVLTKIGKEHMHRFRFSDPLMKPFVLIKAIAEAKIDRALIEALNQSK